MPHSFFEIEHSTDIQNSLLKFNDLQDFYVRMTIVADIKRKTEFECKMNYHAFDELRLNKRVFFRHPAMLQFLKCFPLFGYV